MKNRKRVLRFAAVAAALGAGWMGRAQGLADTVQEYLSRTTAEARTANLMTIGDWTAKHPGDLIETRAQAQRRTRFWYAWNTGERGLEEHWCLRSTAEVALAGGIHVRRIALFYQPLVDQIYGGPLPPLPTESGATLRQHGCRLLRILNEFEGVTDPRGLAETLAQGLTDQSLVELAGRKENAGAEYWEPVFSQGFSRGVGTSNSLAVSGDWTVYVPGRMPRTREDGQRYKADVVLQWRAVSLRYGPPPASTIEPLAGQPWIAGRAAMLAQMRQDITLQMLSFLAPQVGGWVEQPPLYCHRDVVPVLRVWLALAAKAPPNHHVAALVLADQVAHRLPDCAEFAEEPYNYAFENQDATVKARPALEKELGELGVDVAEGNHPPGEYYSGSLLRHLPRFVPTGQVEEVYQMALLDRNECEWNGNEDADCTSFIQEGEKFLSSHPDDEWTPSVQLMLAQGYAMMAAQPENEGQAPDLQREEWLKQEDEHLRTWYAKSRNERNRALVWQEIWGIEAASGPWLLVPGELRN
jgi:hypothetical protein